MYPHLSPSGLVIYVICYRSFQHYFYGEATFFSCPQADVLYPYPGTFCQEKMIPAVTDGPFFFKKITQTHNAAATQLTHQAYGYMLAELKN